MCRLNAAMAALALSLPGTVHSQQFDASVVPIDVPDTILTNEAFLARITLRNTGTKSWSSAVDNDSTVRLAAIGPFHNATWGTWFMISGQGRTGAAGDTFQFESYLHAPSTAGSYDFVWQPMRQVSEQLFGDTIRQNGILVIPNTRQCPVLPTARDSVLTFSDFEYVGSFKVPTVLTHEARYTESGLALRRMGNGTKRLFMNTGTYQHALYEAEIPALVKFSATNKDSLPVAEVKRVWGEVKFAQQYTGETIALDAGFWWDEATRKLYWSYYHGYKAGDAPPVLGICRLDSATGSATYYGPWYVPSAQAGWYKAYWGGVTRLSQQFADTYTQGRTLAVGYGGYFSVCAPATRGPALAAIAEPDTARDSLSLTELLTYRGNAIAPRDGDYFSANCSYWNEPPANTQCGLWNFADHSRAAVFIDLPDKKGFVAFTWMGTGRLGYDYGSITTAGNSHYWYFYDTRDLGEVAAGRKQPDAVSPVSFQKVVYPGNNQRAVAAVSGAVFDHADRTLYLYHPFSIDDLDPVVHAYRVRQAGAVERTAKAGSAAPQLWAKWQDNGSLVVQSTIAAQHMLSPVTVRLYAVDGRLAASATVRAGELHCGVRLEVGALAPGTYVAEAVCGERTALTRAVVGR